MRHVKTPYYLSFFAVLVLGLGLWVLEAEPILPSVNEKLKGVCWVGSRQPLQGGELGVLKKIGANAISQTPFGWQADKNKPEIRWSLDAERQWWGESARGDSSHCRLIDQFGDFQYAETTSLGKRKLAWRD